MVPVSTYDGARNAPSTQSGFVLVSTYSWMCITLGVAIARFGQGLVVHKIQFGLDDGTVLAGSVVYLGAVVAWQYAVNGGLGRDWSSLSADETTLFFKAFYIAELLGIFAMTLAKVSSAFLIDRVAPQTRKAKTILYAMCVVWAIYAAFAIAFECGIPSWTESSFKCGNGGLSISVIVLNMITDLVLAGWLVPTLWSLSLDKEKCMTATVLFGARVVVPFAAGAQAWATATAKTASSRNLTRDAVNLALITQAVTSLSLIVASIPRIKRFLGVGGSGILYPQIQATEISLSRRSLSRQESRITEPRLVPSGSGKFTVTVSSKGAKEKKKSRPHSDWQGLVTMGTKEDEHTSTSSLFDRDDHGGVMMQQEVRVSVEDNHTRVKCGP